MSGSPTAMNAIASGLGNLTKKKNVGLLRNSLEEGFVQRTLFQFVPALVAHICVNAAGRILAKHSIGSAILCQHMFTTFIQIASRNNIGNRSKKKLQISD